MGLIVRYILRELGLTFLFGFVALTSLLLIVGIVQEALDRHVPLIYIPQLIPFVFAGMSPISLPVTLLLAVTVFFSRMSGSNEVVALKALGVSPTAFLMPVFVIAIIFSVIGVGINELAITWGRMGVNAIIYRSVEEILLGQLTKTYKFETDNKQIEIMVKGVDKQRRLIEPTIILKKEAVTIEAQTAQISINFDKNELTINFTGMRITGDRGNMEILGGDRMISISLSEIVPTGESNRPSDMDMNRISQARRNTAEEIERQQRIIVAHKAFAASMGSVDAWTTPQIDAAKGIIHSLQTYDSRLSVEPPRRWATGFCCFFFVWLGAPLAIWMRQSDFFASFFACFIPILIFYYPLFAFGLSQAKSGSLPPLCVWTANTAIGLIGFWFYRQIHRY